jgi:hypothetical protein
VEGLQESYMPGQYLLVNYPYFTVEPASQPVVEGLLESYMPGQYLNLTCVCRETHPAANISWFLDGTKV